MPYSDFGPSFSYTFESKVVCMQNIPAETVEREGLLEARSMTMKWSRLRGTAARPRFVKLEDVVLRVREGVRRSGGER